MSLVSGPGRGGIKGNDAPGELPLCVENHVKYIQSLDKRKDELEYWLTEHLRLNGVYWGLTALHLLGHPDALPRDETIKFVMSCRHENGGFGAAPNHDSHMLYTTPTYRMGKKKWDDVYLHQRTSKPSGLAHTIYADIARLQDPATGAFAGDEWGETDTRFLYGALNALSLLQLVHLVDLPKAIDYVQACVNFDGGYGVCPGAESHAGQIFTCVGALAIAGRLDLVDRDRLGGWLSERQLDNGGLNGRPEKLEDVCYSWWVVSSLAMIERMHWIDVDKLAKFILRCQVGLGLVSYADSLANSNKDPEMGGIADRPGDMVDVFHTVFGIAGLSLLGFPSLKEVDPVYCMPLEVTKRALR